VGTQGTFEEKQKNTKKLPNVVYATIWIFLTGIQATLQDKQKNDRKARNRCVRDDLEDFDGYSGDIRREAKEQQKSSKTLCTQRFGIF
jgi:hypothetical protein